MSSAAGSSMFKQPKAVYAVAFACVVSFMGIGLVDPILPALAAQLSLTPAGTALVAERRAQRTRRLDMAVSGLSPDDVARIADAVPALIRLTDALRRSSKEVTR